MNNVDIVEAWERRVGAETAHLQEGQHINKAGLNCIFREGFRGIGTDQKVILDYGCGGGFLGLFLFEGDYPIKQYIGVDITLRAIKATLERLDKWKSFKRVEATKIDPKNIPDLSIFKVDILTCFNVVQHFPDKEYFEYFFEQLNNSEIPIIILNYRKGEKLTFQDEPYKRTHEINLACYNRIDDIKALLPNYKLIKSPKKNKSGFETVQFKIKEMGSME